MAATRKLQTEIQQCMKKLDEGVEIFNEIWEKVYTADTQSLKEKFEADLKKEIKKLQRLRDQIKAWISSPEIKDKTQLVEARKTIESKMEQFKVCERDTKTKAYSKEGLARDSRMDPKDALREEKRNWLNDCLDCLQDLNNTVEADKEKLSSGKNKSKNKEELGRLENRLQKQKWHMAKIELIIKLIDNEELDPTLIDSIKDSVEYYLETAPEDDGQLGVEHEFDIYEDLDLDSYNVAPVQVEIVRQTTAQLEEEATAAAAAAAASGSTVVPAAPISTPPTTIVHNGASTTAITANTTTTIEHKAPPKSAAATPAATADKASAGEKQEKAPLAQILKGAAAKTEKVEPAAPPGIAKHPAASATATAAAKEDSHATEAKKNETSPRVAGKPETKTPATVPATASKVPVAALLKTNPATAAASAAATAAASETKPMPAPGLTPAAAAKTSTAAAAAATTAATLPPPALAAATTTTAAPVTTGPPPALATNPPAAVAAAASGASAALPPPLSQNTATAAATTVAGPAATAAIPVPAHPSATATASAPVPNALAMLTPDQQQALFMLKQSATLMPEEFQYIPRHPNPTSHPLFPSTPICTNNAEYTALFEKLPMDTMFFSFYFQQNTFQQTLAAKRLKKNSWRYHKKYVTWFQRHSEPKMATQEFEEGTYLYFDYDGGWSQRIKADFKFEYGFLEDELN